MLIFSFVFKVVGHFVYCPPVEQWVKNDKFLMFLFLKKENQL